MLLDKIVENKKKEVAELKKKRPLDSFKESLAQNPRSFRDALRDEKIALIAEIKKASPSEGVMREDFDVAEIARVCSRYAQAISVLTDEKFFKGSLQDLRTAYEHTELPLLRKDFIIDEYQIYEARYAGASAVLLIARILSEDEIKRFIRLAKTYGMDCLVEVHSREELEKALKAGADVIGINNRDLDTLSIDLSTTRELQAYIPRNKIIVAESGITSPGDLRKLGSVDAVLVGTVFMKAKNIEKTLQEFARVQARTA